MSLKKSYILGDQIGSGSMATVCKAVQKSLDRLVAVKRIHPHLAERAEFVTRFEREARAAAHLKHINIMDIIDFGKDEDGHYFIVVEYIDGPTLLDLMKASAKVPLEIVIGAVVQLLAGLEHAHNAGVVHRDIKPENLMFNSGGVVKITDFGIAQAAKLPSLTHAGQKIGTPSYMSPEQAEGKRIDHRSDLFSVGIILYEMVTGKLPFQGSSVSTINKIVNEPPPPIHSVDPTVAPPLVRIIDRALQKDVTKRFFDAAEFAHALEDFAFEAGLRTGVRFVKTYLESNLGVAEQSKETAFTPSQISSGRGTSGFDKSRPTAAILPLQGCMGCHVNLLDLHEGFLDLHKMLDIRFTHLMDVKDIPDVDVGLVEGCVANTENVERLKLLRSKCQALIAFGTCACFGGIPGLRNLHRKASVIKRAYLQSESTAQNGAAPDPGHVPDLLEFVQPVGDVVEVDHFLPGCPPPHSVVLESVSNLISGTRLKIPTHTLCHQCGRRHQEMLTPQRKFIANEVRSIMEVEKIDPELCFLEQGVPCLGLATREGCGARCLSYNVPCQGCMGPPTKVRETGAKWIDTMGSLLPGGNLRFKHDVVGLGYRYTLPISIMPYKVGEEV